MRIGWSGKVSSHSTVTFRNKWNLNAQVIAMSLVPAFIREALLQKNFPIRGIGGRELVSLPYRAFLASSKADFKAAFKLRFKVFNLELNEGLEQAYQTGEDTDEFDRFCDHILVADDRTGEIVGTYRLQTGIAAGRHIGYYSEREFDFAPYRILRDELVELGRACIHPEHRKYEVLMLLWKAIAQYAVDNNARYLIGCSSLTSQCPREGSAVYERLKPTLVAEELRTTPSAAYAFELANNFDEVSARPPKLLRTYLALGANICGPPAFDREFKTIDFLTLMDLHNLTPAIRARLLAS